MTRRQSRSGWGLLGFLETGSALSAISGRELEAMSDAKLSRLLATASVFARAAPAQKLRIVRALQAPLA